MSLLADNGTAPGNQIAVLGTISDTNLSSSPASLDLASLVGPLNVSLSASTRYWIELTPANGGSTNAAWDYSTDLSGVGVASEYFFDGSTATVYSDTSSGQAFQMSVTLSPVPETASMLSMCMGLGGMAWLATGRSKTAGR